MVAQMLSLSAWATWRSEAESLRWTTGHRRRRPDAGAAHRRRGERWVFHRKPGGQREGGGQCEAKTLSGPPAGLGPIQTQQTTNVPVVRDAVDQGPFLDIRLLGQLGRAHWATFGPVALSAR
jgi:hypothetical protein